MRICIEDAEEEDPQQGHYLSLKMTRVELFLLESSLLRRFWHSADDDAKRIMGPLNSAAAELEDAKQTLDDITAYASEAKEDTFTETHGQPDLHWALVCLEVFLCEVKAHLQLEEAQRTAAGSDSGDVALLPQGPVLEAMKKLCQLYRKVLRVLSKPCDLEHSYIKVLRDWMREGLACTESLLLLEGDDYGLALERSAEEFTHDISCVPFLSKATGLLHQEVMVQMKLKLCFLSAW